MKKLIGYIADIFRDPVEKNERYHKRQRLMDINDKLTKPKVFTAIYGAFALLFLFLVNFAIAGIKALSSSVHIGVDGVTAERPAVNPFIPCIPPGLFAVLFIFLLIGYVVFAYKVKVSYGRLDVGQHGTSRWTTRAEIKEQYKRIPDTKERFPGYGGFPIAREGNTLFIDDTPVNNLLIGMTRSGKGEIFVFPLIDIYSRAQFQPSMIITDPKLELAPAAIPTLCERGYDYHIINLIDPEYSAGFNPLYLITQQYKAGDVADAQLLCQSFCATMFSPDTAGENKFFEDNSISLLTAIILASIEDCIEADRLENAKRKFNTEKENKRRKEEAFKRLSYEEKKLYRLQRQIKMLLKENPESLAGQLAGELSVSEAEIQEAQAADEIKLIYKEKEYTETHENEKKINLFSVVNTFAVLSSTSVGRGKNMLDIYFEERPEGNISRLLYASTGSAGEKTKGSIYSNMLSALKIFTYENIAKLTAKSTIDLKRIGFGGKPVAVFIGMPDYDSSNYFLISTFISQLYLTLARMATHSPTGKCGRQVVFILDEFGNFPVIKDVDHFLNVGLGRNIYFNLILQSYMQLENIYGEKQGKIIKEACGNSVYILTNSSETTKEFSAELGTETITVVNRTGKIFSLSKERTEMQQERPLLTPKELTELLPGEVIVNRLKRTDLEGGGIKSHPIANMGEDKMLYRYQYLLGDFPSGNILYDSPQMQEVYKLIKEEQQERAKAGFKEKIKDRPEVLDIAVENTKDIVLDEIIWSADLYIRKKMPAKSSLPLSKIISICLLLDIKSDDIEDIMYEELERAAIAKTKADDEEERAKGFSALELLSLEEENTIADELDEIFSALTDFITVDMNLQEQQAEEEPAASKEHLKRRPEKEQRKRRIM